MINKEFNYLRVLSVLSLSGLLASCGGDGSNFKESELGLTDKQAIAKIVVDSTDLLELINLIVNTAESVEGLSSRTVRLDCNGGSGTISVINNAPIATFEAGDLILINATSCNGTDGIFRDGEFSVSASTNGYIGEFNNYGEGSSSVTGAMTIIPTSNYNPRTGTGSLQASIDQITGVENGLTTVIKNGNYRLSLTGNIYAYSAEHEVESNEFDGVSSVATGTPGLGGNTSFVGGNLIASNPQAGEITITFPDKTIGTVFANNGDSSTYDLTVDGETTTVSW